MTPAARAAAAGTLLSLLSAAGCGGAPPQTEDDADLAALEEATEEEAEGLLAQTNERPVLLFFPSQDGDELVPEERIIFLTSTLTSQVKQAVSEVLLGPTPREDEEDASAVPAFPARTRLLAIFILDDGTAIVDLGSEASAIPQGSAAELTAVYSIVNTVTFKFPGVHRVRILLEGKEVPTLVGHVDLSRPLPADLKRVNWGRLGAPSEPSEAAAPWERWILEESAVPDKDPTAELNGPI